MDATKAQAMYQAHADWVWAQIAAGVDGAAPADRPDPSDYSEHFADMEAPAADQDELHGRLRKIVGLPPLRPMAGP